jgi:peptidoglycan/xylan/chitin deacetylase (PgdA/CDA1 family)
MAGVVFSRTTIALMYHAVGAANGPAVDPHYRVDEKRFRDQLALSIRHGGGAISTHDWLAGKRGVIYTFDDGLASDHDLAWPILASAGGRGDFFVNPAQVGTPGYATWTQLRAMSDGGMSIQSHGLDHRHFLTELSPHHLREELRRARLEIEDKVGKPVTLLAPPGGRSPARLEQIAIECGYTHVLDSRPGRVESETARTFSRLAVTAQLGLPQLEAWLLRKGTAIVRMQVRYQVLDLAKRAFGDDTYQNLRKRFLRTPAA